MASVEVPSFFDGCCVTTYTGAEFSGAETEHIKLKIYMLNSLAIVPQFCNILEVFSFSQTS